MIKIEDMKIAIITSIIITVMLGFQCGSTNNRYQIISKNERIDTDTQNNLVYSLKQLRNVMTTQKKSISNIEGHEKFRYKEFWDIVKDSIKLYKNQQVIDEVILCLNVDFDMMIMNEKFFDLGDIARYSILEQFRNKNALDLLLKMSLSKIELKPSDFVTEYTIGVSGYARRLLINYFEDFDNMKMIDYVDNIRIKYETLSSDYYRNQLLIWEKYHFDYFKEIIKKEKYSFSSPNNGSTEIDRYPNGEIFPIN